ncbi:Protein of unknown function [Candidatus Hamiltonella defensa (Bemisia tabaci)]|nr:Protein of unknown function [Candidatus Hamiltonella defensa (Bemisia tabaci)]
MHLIKTLPVTLLAHLVAVEHLKVFSGMRTFLSEDSKIQIKKAVSGVL